jgi:uncharacterized protein YggE
MTLLMRRLGLWFCALAGVLTMFACLAAGAQEEREEKTATISVSGTGKVSALPDIAEISIGVVSRAKSAKDATAANAEAMTTVNGLLKERGVAAKDIETAQFQIAPRYAEPRRNTEDLPAVVGFQVNNTVNITVRQVDKLGTLLDVLIGGGANQIHSLSFRVDQPDKLLDEARRRAVANARHTAELLAGEAGVVLGAPLKIVDTGQNNPIPPRRFFTLGAAAPAMAAPTPIAAGEQELSASVQVVYLLKQAK